MMVKKITRNINGSIVDIKVYNKEDGEIYTFDFCVTPYNKKCNDMENYLYGLASKKLDCCCDDIVILDIHYIDEYNFKICVPLDYLTVSDFMVY